MAAPTYSEDLTDIDLAEVTTGWTAVGGGAAGLSASPDLAMQGTNCVDKQITAANKGMLFDSGAGLSPGADDHIFVWLFVATPGLTDTRANQGAVIAIGTASTAYNSFHVEGNDTYGAKGRVGVCYPIRYLNTANGSEPFRTLTGVPGTNPQWVGGKLNTTGSVKGANLGVDALRIGTGAYITAGDGATPATFAGFATQNDAIANRWGILTDLGGVFELQGRFVVGQNNAKTATAAHFDDTGVTITLADTIHSLSDFTQIIIDHASTVFNLTNVTIISPFTTNPGQLVFNNASTTAALTGCVFDGMGITTLRAGVVATGCTWRNTAQITQNGATLTDCFIAGSTVGDGVAAIVSDTLAPISGCSFTFSDGHAIEITAPGTYTFTGNTFTGYGAAASNDAAIYNNSGGLVTINVGGGGDTPTIRNGASASTVVNNNVTVTFTGMKDNTEVRIFDSGDDSVIGGIENATAGTTDNRSFAWSDAASNDVYYIIHSELYETIRVEGFIVPTTDTAIPIQQRLDRNYNNP